MKSKANTKKPIAELGAGPSPSPELEIATGRPGLALKKAEELYKSLFELSPVGIATVNSNLTSGIPYGGRPTRLGGKQEVPEIFPK